jgi:hypothetical protein
MEDCFCDTEPSPAIKLRCGTTSIMQERIVNHRSSHPAAIKQCIIEPGNMDKT